MGYTLAFSAHRGGLAAVAAVFIEAMFQPVQTRFKRRVLR
jgi:hypothetical protein